MNDLLNSVNKLVQKELYRANKKHELFNSAHEAYAVILEELEEAEDELNNLKCLLNYFWASVKKDKNENFQRNLELAQKYSRKMIAEAVQVSAMIDKACISLGAKNDAREKNGVN